MSASPPIEPNGFYETLGPVGRGGLGFEPNSFYEPLGPVEEVTPDGGMRALRPAYHPSVCQPPLRREEAGGARLAVVVVER